MESRPSHCESYDNLFASLSRVNWLDNARRSIRGNWSSGIDDLTIISQTTDDEVSSHCANAAGDGSCVRRDHISGSTEAQGHVISAASMAEGCVLRIISATICTHSYDVGHATHRDLADDSRK